MDIIKKCPVCQRDYYPLYSNVAGIKKCLWFPACDCEKKAIQKLEEEKRAQELKIALKKRFSNSLLSPVLQEARFENLDDTKAKEACIKFVETFQPHKSKGFAFIGHVGRGKTTLIACVTNMIIKKGYNCLFINLTLLLDKFMEAMKFTSTEKVENLLYWLCQFDFIVFDDFGAESFSDKRVEHLRLIVDSLVNYKVCLSITANPDALALLKDPEFRFYKDFIPILDRISLLCPNEFLFKGESYRRFEQKSFDL